MAIDKALAARMFQAQHRLEGRLGHKLVLREIAEAFAKAHGAEDPPDPSVVRRWLIGQQEPRGREEWIALSVALDVDPGWLAFGPASAAPMTPTDATRESVPGREPPPSELELANRAVQASRASRKTPRRRPSKRANDR